MKQCRLQRTALLSAILFIGLIGTVVLWLRVQRRQYALNRQLIAALVNGDDKQALALVNAGADPNTRYKPTPVPSLPELVNRLFHGSALPVNDSPSAFTMVCGVQYGDGNNTQTFGLDDAPLVQTMLRHGADVNMKDELGWTPLLRSVCFRHPKTVKVLLEHGAHPNTLDVNRDSPLIEGAEWNTAPEIVGLLSAYGAKVNHQNKSGETALSYAVYDSADKEMRSATQADG